MNALDAPLMLERAQETLGVCGSVRSGIHVHAESEFDCEAPNGSTGKRVVHTDAPLRLNPRYFGKPEAAAQAWRSGWFHTVEAMWLAKDGNHFLVYRMTSATRRRGENIWPFEVRVQVGVEVESLPHLEVRGCAVITAPAATEDEVLAIVYTTPGAEPDPAEPFEILLPRQAHFRLPRCVRKFGELASAPAREVNNTRLRQ